MVKKKIILMIAVLFFISVYGAALFGCASYTDGAATTGYAFVQKIVEQDFDGAYDYVYSLTSDVQSRSDFISRFTNIYQALEITEITLLNRNVEEKEENEYTLTYSLQMNSGLLGTVTYHYTADIVSGPLGYSVIYTPALILPMMEEGDKVRVMNQSGARGEIFSADGKLLAKNDYAQSVYIDLDKDPDIEQVKSLLSSLFDADAEKIQAKYNMAIEKEYPVMVLLTYPRGTLTAEQIAQIGSVQGLGVDDERLTATRYYPLGDNAAHVIGYLGSPSQAQMEQWAGDGVTESSQVGQMGIELAYEQMLRGTDGSIVYIEDSRGEQKQVLYEDAKTDGADVYLTIDTTLQNTAYTLLASNCTPEQSGAVVVLDYTNGDVKAMVSYPSFDNNLFNPVDKAVWDYYNSAENLTPLYPRATQAAYMPGSTFKVFTAVPAIESGLLDASSSPVLTISENKWLPSNDGFAWNYPVITRVSTPAAFDFENCIKSSDNIFFAYYALKLGKDAMISYLERVGIGQAPEFELPILASSYKKDDTELNDHWLATTGYGMGALQITPIQLACMYTALMNEGDILNPTIVEKVSRSVDNVETVEWEHARTVFKEDIMQPSTIEMEKTALRRVVTDGTAYEANLRDVEGLIAKTGTATMGEREINWVIAIDQNSEDHLLYLVTVDTAKDVGTEPKLSILNGLVKPENYNNALRQDPFGESATGSTQNTGDPADSGSSNGEEE